MCKEVNNFSFFQASFRKGFIAPNLPIVTVQHNDLRLNLLIDSGSDNNVIDQTVLTQIKYGKPTHIGATHLTGVGGTQTVEACSFSFQCGAETYTEDFLVTDFQMQFGMIEDCHGIQLHGMLGTEFMRKNNIVLDFSNLVAYTKPPIKKAVMEEPKEKSEDAPIATSMIKKKPAKGKKIKTTKAKKAKAEKK